MFIPSIAHLTCNRTQPLPGILARTGQNYPPRSARRPANFHHFNSRHLRRGTSSQSVCPPPSSQHLAKVLALAPRSRRNQQLHLDDAAWVLKSIYREETYAVQLTQPFHFDISFPGFHPDTNTATPRSTKTNASTKRHDSRLNA